VGLRDALEKSDPVGDNVGLLDTVFVTVNVLRAVGTVRVTVEDTVDD